jgi:alpha-beta hydrolase superfamily lysophospholipase
MRILSFWSRSGAPRSSAGALFRLIVLCWLTSLSAAAAADPFYAANPTELEGKPGTIIRVQPIPPPNGAAAAYRVLYRSTGLKNEPIAVSGMILVPPGTAPAEGRPIVAWAHGTTGVAAHCAPTLDPKAYEGISGLSSFLSHGYVVAATDYPGLGTAGIHPYLIGVSQGRAVVDAARAARAIPQTQSGHRFIPWGYSQGGHAALFAGIVAKTYAPEMTLAGIAATAPPTELGSLIRADISGAAGRVLSAFALWSWSHLYGIPIDSALDKRVVLTLPRLANTCTETSQDKFQLLLGEQAFEENGFLRADVTTKQPWRGLIEGNTPGITPPGVPVFLAQGSVDTIVAPLITELYSDELCSHHRPVHFVLVNGAGHPEMAKAATRAATAWIADRFAGLPPPTSCEAQ